MLFMKQILTYILVLCSIIGFSQNSITLPIKNNPLPTDTLRILMIGNSFTYDATEYIGEIVHYSGIDENTCCVYRVITEGGDQLKDWRDRYRWKSVRSIEKVAGHLTMGITNGTLQELFHQNWDVISLQQLSRYSIDISTYSPYLEDLLSYIYKDCVNKDVAICWNLPWSSWVEYANQDTNEYDGWQKIVSATEEMIQKYGVDIIIPSGTAIQNARATKLNTEKSLTRDGHHIDLGIGRYIVACTLYESLFEPVYGITIQNILWHPNMITNTMAKLARECVSKAIDNWHDTTNLENMTYNDEIIISPNPVTKYVFICNVSKTNPVTCIIYDSMGRRIYKEKILGYTYIDFSNYKRGIYTIQLKSGKTIKTQHIEKI